MSFASRTRQGLRKCSHCRSTNHTVNSCDDVSLSRFDTRLRNKRDELREIGIDNENSLFYFETWLLSIEPGLLKSYAMRHCGANSRISTVHCVHKITQKIFQHVEEEDEAQEEFIPFVEEPFQLITDEEMQFIDPDIVERYHMMRGSRREPRTSENRKYNIETLLKEKEKEKEKETETATVTATAEEKEEKETATAEEKEACPICYEDESMVKLNCGHEFCGTCVQSILKKCCPSKQPRCAMCRVNMSSFEFEDLKAFEKMKSNLVLKQN